ncbi:MAG: thioredoxin family protein [Acidimicrobiales bacterium]|nr:MAG: thioredoxin family protein [Acidimicrobiales bacterium]
MVAVNSTMLPLGTQAPYFELPDPDGNTWTLDSFADAPVLVVAFVCNHCPYVQHIAPRLGEVADELRAEGAALVAINSNDYASYPEDAPAKMREYAERWGWRFPYLIDEEQVVAKAYRAACTPDFFVFDSERRLAYRGQFDDSRPGNDVPVTGNDLAAAVRALLTGEPVPEDQKPSLGCNIKWKPGSEPEWFNN